MKREASEPLLNDVALCTEMGWTYQQLQEQPAKFIEILQIYLNTVSDKQKRERKRFQEEMQRLQTP